MGGLFLREANHFPFCSEKPTECITWESQVLIWVTPYVPEGVEFHTALTLIVLIVGPWKKICFYKAQGYNSQPP